MYSCTELKNKQTQKQQSQQPALPCSPRYPQRNVVTVMWQINTGHGAGSTGQLVSACHCYWSSLVCTYYTRITGQQAFLISKTYNSKIKNYFFRECRRHTSYFLYINFTLSSTSNVQTEKQ